jgi:hypothetical protein
MKKIIIYIVLILALPVLLQAQYSGGNGKGDVMLVSLNNQLNLNAPYSGGNGRGDIMVSLTNINIRVQEVSVVLPTKYDLAQNFPNPFNPSTTIRYAIPRNVHVRLIVFDALGREVETLVNEKQTAGVYEATFNASQYSSGVYIYKLKTEGYSETKKMILLK